MTSRLRRTLARLAGGWLVLACSAAPALAQSTVIRAVDSSTGASVDSVGDAATNSIKVSQAGNFLISGIVAVSQSGTWTVQPGNTANTTAWLVNGAGGTFPVTGTFWQATQPVSGPLTDTQLRATAVPVSGTFFQATQPISAAALPLPSGASTVAEQQTQTTALQLIDNLPNTQGSTTSGQSGVLTLGAVTTAAPSYTTAQSSPLSLTTAGALRTDASATTQPVSGTVTANAGSGTFTVGDGSGALTVDGTVTVTDGAGALNVIIDSGTTTVTQGTATNLKAQAEAYQGGSAVAAGNPLQVTLANTGANATAVKVDGSASTQPVSGTVSCSNCSGSGASFVDDAPFTVATDSGAPAMGLVTGDSVNSGDVGVLGMLANRQLKVTLFDSGGVELAVGGGTQYTEDAPAAANPVGNALIGVRADTLGALTTTDGDNVAARMTDKGELYVKQTDAVPVTDNGGSLTVDGTVTANLGTIGGAATAAKQPALGTAGSASTDVLTVQGIASMTPIQVADNGGTLSVDDGGGSITVDGTVTVTDGAGALNVIVDSGSLTANAGTNLNTSALALESGGNLAGAATSLAVIDDWDETDRAKVNPIVGQAGIQGGAGAVSATTTRVAFATDANVIQGAGTAGSASGGVVSVQGVASMTPLLVTPAANSAVNLAQIAGNTTPTGTGVATNTQRVTLSKTYGSKTTITWTGTSLGNTSMRQSTVVDMTSTTCGDVRIRIQSKGQTSGTSYIRWYVYTALGDTTYTAGASGSDGTYTAALLENARFLGTQKMNAGTTATQMEFLLSDIFGTTPDKWGLIGDNETGAALSATAGDHVLEYSCVN